MKKVIIVEDDCTQREFLHVLMGQNNYWSKVCSSAEEVIKAISTGSMPDVLLVDYYLPGKDGIQLIEEIRKLPGGVTPRCILLTAGDRVQHFDKLNDRAREHNFLILFKPYEVHNLLQLIATPLEK